MKAVRIHAHGGVDQLRYEDGAEPAVRREDDVIIKLKAAAVNRIDDGDAVEAVRALTGKRWRREGN